MIAGIVYFISASAAGAWVAEKVVVPVFALLDEYRIPAATNNSEPEMVEQSAQVELDSTKKAVDVDVSLPAISCFAVQAGVYASSANAQSQAALLQSAGEAGYVLQDGNRYRVLSEAYESEADARQRKDQHLAQGRDRALYAINTNAASYRVSALEEQLEGVNTGFAAIAKAQKALCTVVLDLSRGVHDAASAQGELQSIGSALQSDMSLLCDYEGEHAALSDILTCYNDCLGAIEKAANSDPSNLTSFAAQAKYAQLSVADSYSKLMTRLSYAGSTPSVAS